MDYAAWRQPLHCHSSLEAAISGGLVADGIHQIPCEGGVLDVLISGAAKLCSTENPGVVLVTFSGAVFNRGGKRPPFFSGRGVAKELGLPLVAFSDPTLALASDISLAWYAGNEQIPGLPRHIARIVESIATGCGVKPILFGGSGGGFAVLQQMTLLEVDAAGLVWNPQTSIAEYVPDAVALYIATAFPSLREQVLVLASRRVSERRQAMFELLEQSGIMHDLRSALSEIRGSVVYLQNSADWHVARHAKPFLEPGRWQRLSSRAFGLAELHGCLFGCWGKGHAPPPRALIVQVLRDIVKGVSARGIVSALDKAEGVSPYFSWAKSDGVTDAPELDIKVSRGGVQISCRLSPVEKEHEGAFEYAFYLVAGGVRVAARAYQSDASAWFALPQGDEPLRVVAFVRDAIGSVRSRKVLLDGLARDVGLGLVEKE